MSGKLRKIRTTLAIAVALAMVISMMHAPIISHAETIKDRDWYKYRSTYVYERLPENEKNLFDELDAVCNKVLIDFS